MVILLYIFAKKETPMKEISKEKKSYNIMTILSLRWLWTSFYWTNKTYTQRRWKKSKKPINQQPQEFAEETKESFENPEILANDVSAEDVSVLKVENEGIKAKMNELTKRNKVLKNSQQELGKEIKEKEQSEEELKRKIQELTASIESSKK